MSRAKPFAVERDPEVVAARLAACGRPVWPSVLAFQRDFAGLRWPSNELALEFREIEPDPDDPFHLDDRIPRDASGVARSGSGASSAG